MKDSSTLLPVHIAANTNKQFWVTVHVPENASSGRYSGRITLSTSTARHDLNLMLEVLPFELLKPYYTSSMYYHNPHLSARHHSAFPTLRLSAFA